MPLSSPSSASRSVPPRSTWASKFPVPSTMPATKSPPAAPMVTAAPSPRLPRRPSHRLPAAT